MKGLNTLTTALNGCKLSDVKWLGSEEELNDLKAAYTSSRGDMDKIIDSVLCATVEDESRFREILTRLITDGSVKPYAAFTNEKKTKATARKRKVRVHTHARTHNRFTALLEYVQDHPGEQVPER